VTGIFWSYSQPVAENQHTFINEQLVWRNPDPSGLPPNSICIESPYDIEAKIVAKGKGQFLG
jgi:hypothetical protein